MKKISHLRTLSQQECMKALKSNSTKMNEKENLRNLRDKERKKMHKN